MTKHPDVRVILSGDPAEAMEAAKRIIEHEDVDIHTLTDIATNETCAKWSRVAAIYTLGFIDDKSKSARALTRILANRNEDQECRAHAAEALGHMEEPKAISVMAKILMAEDSPEVKKWCVYALTELGGSETRSILEQFATTTPTGTLADELRLALSPQGHES